MRRAARLAVPLARWRGRLAYHTRRFTMVPRLNKALRVPTPADRGPGRPWRPGTPPPAPIDPDLPSADIRIGYARCSTLGQELDSLSKHGIPRDKIFRVIFTVYEMKRLGRDAAELTVLADHLTAHGLVLEMLAGPLPGIYDPTGPGKLLFAFFAAKAETERENHPGVDVGGARHRGPQGQARRPAAGHHRRHAPHRAATPCTRRVRRADPARPDHPHRQAQGASPSVASIYRALAEHAKREAYPEAVTQAHADFAALQAGEVPGLCLALPDRASL